jgi:hypothetical protein
MLPQAPSLQYQIYPRIDRLDCRTDDIGGGAGPTAQAQRRRLLFGGDTPASNAAKLGLVVASLTCALSSPQPAAPCKGSNEPAACICPVCGCCARSQETWHYGQLLT